MKYFVGHMIEGKAADYYVKITTDLSEKFGIRNLSLTHPPHFTLKAPFSATDITPLKDKLKQLASDLKPVSFLLNDFGLFGEGKVIYLEPAENSELHASAQFIADEIVWFGDDKLELPKPLVLHASIARYLEPQTSPRIWSYLKDLPKPDLGCKFDNVTIFRYEKGSWVTDSVFRFD